MKIFKCFGLSVLSDFDLRCVPEGPLPANSADVVIEQGVIRSELPGSVECDGYAQVTNGQCLVTIPAVARFEITEGTNIRIDPDPEAVPLAVEAYLLGTVFGILIHQRKEYPFHASVMKGSNGGVAFTAPSGAGKSSLIAFLARSAQVSLLSDDMGRIPFDNEPEVRFHAGPRKLKLWDDAAGWLKMPKDGRQRDLARENKFHYRGSESAWIPQCKLDAIAYLKRSRDAKIKLEKVTGENAIRVVLAGIFRPTIGAIVQTEERLFMNAARIAQSLDVYILSRPWGFEYMEETRQSLYSADLI